MNIPSSQLEGLDEEEENALIKRTLESIYERNKPQFTKTKKKALDKLAKSLEGMEID